MGYNTAMIVLNDGMDTLKSDPDVGEKLYRGILAAGHRQTRNGADSHTVSLGNHCNPVAILPSQHADTLQIVAIGANSIRPLAYCHWQDDDEQVLRKLAEHLGFTVRRKPTRVAA
jgi:GAF domain-containing protein